MIYVSRPVSRWPFRVDTASGRLPRSLPSEGKFVACSIRWMLGQEKLTFVTLRSRHLTLVIPEAAHAGYRKRACFHADLSRQFDEYIWFDKTSPVKPLSTTWESGQPETYPFGL